MSDSLVERLLTEQRGRLVASVMGHCEREVFADLTEAQRKALRKKVLESVGVFYDFCRDALRASAADAHACGVVLNEEALRLLGEIHAEIKGA